MIKFLKWLEERKILENDDKKTPEERQKIDKAVRKVHMDKYQVQDVVDTLPKHLQDDFMKELRRRGGKHYPERGK